MRISLVFLLLLLSVIIYAQTGTIRGTVIDHEFGEPMFSANVFVKGTTNGTVTDLDGNFELQVDDINKVDIQFSYIGYKTITIEGVEVKPGEITLLDKIFIKEDNDLGVEIVVTAEAIKNNEVSLINLKLKSPGMLDGISSDKIRQTGDANAAEATKRVTGVTVENGKYVYVRGLGDRYSKSMLNGVDIPGLDPDRNTLQMDIFPTSLINNITISKNFTADLPADFTGGLINVETKDFPEEKKFNLSLSTTFNPNYHFNSNYLNYQGGNLDFLGFDDGTRALPSNAKYFVPTPYTGNTQQDVVNFNNQFNKTLAAERQMSFMDFNAGISLGNQIALKKRGTDELSKNKLGYIFSLSYKSNFKHYSEAESNEYQRTIGANDYELIEANTQIGEISERNFLVGGLAGISFKTLKSKFNLTLMHIQNGESKAAKFHINNNAAAVGQSGYEAFSDNLEYNQRSLTNVLLRGNHIFNSSKWEIDWRISPTYSLSEDPDIRKTAFSYDGTYSFASGEAGNPTRIWRSLNEINTVAKVDLKKDLSINDFKMKLKFGVAETFKIRNYNIRLFEILFSRPQSWDSGDASVVLAEENLYPNNVNGAYTISSNSNPNSNEYSSNSNNLGAYVSTEFNITAKFKSILGLRGEYFVQRHTGRDITYANGNTIDGNNLVNEKVLESINIFPTANFIYSFTEKHVLRGSYSRTIARPSFKELSFAQIIDPMTSRIFNGSLFPFSSVENGQVMTTWDGQLLETNIDNADLRWELFLKSKAQFISASVFFKNFNNPIELVRIPEQQTNAEYQARNVGTGRVYGFEFELRKNFDFIAEALENLVFSSNVTLVYSEIQMSDLEYNARKIYEKEGQSIGRTRDMAGQSPYVVNCGLSYDNEKLGFSTGLFYNVKGPTLIIVGTGLIPDIYSEPFHSLNFSFTKKIGKEQKSSVSFKVSNILNDRLESHFVSYGAEKQIFNSINPGVSFSLGVNVKL